MPRDSALTSDSTSPWYTFTSVSRPQDANALPVLAAHAPPDLEVAADRVDAGDDLGAVADQVRAADRVGELAVLDQVSLREAEHEVARRGVHLPAGKALRVQAFLHAANDLFGVVGARQDVRV